MDTERQKNTINMLYIMLVISTILSFVPNGMAQLGSLVLIIVVLLAAYVYKARDVEDGLMHNHMTYMIGTVWIGTTFLLLGALATGLWVYLKGDQSVLTDAIAQIQNGIVPNDAEINAITSNYVSSNQGLLITASLVALGPAVLYFVYRVANGFSRACKGYRIANPKSWL